MSAAQRKKLPPTSMLAVGAAFLLASFATMGLAFYNLSQLEQRDPMLTLLKAHDAGESGLSLKASSPEAVEAQLRQWSATPSAKLPALEGAALLGASKLDKTRYHILWTKEQRLISMFLTPGPEPSSQTPWRCAQLPTYKINQCEREQSGWAMTLISSTQPAAE